VSWSDNGEYISLTLLGLLYPMVNDWLLRQEEEEDEEKKGCTCFLIPLPPG